MRFWEAMKIVDEGGKVKRELWGDEWLWLVYNQSFSALEVWAKNNFNCWFRPDRDDMVSTDWIEVKDE